MKANAVAKSGDDTRDGTSDWRVGDSKVGAKHNNQLLNDEGSTQSSKVTCGISTLEGGGGGREGGGRLNPTNPRENATNDAKMPRPEMPGDKEAG